MAFNSKTPCSAHGVRSVVVGISHPISFTNSLKILRRLGCMGLPFKIENASPLA